LDDDQRDAVNALRPQSTRRTSASDHGARWHPRDFLGGRAELADRLKRIVPAGQAVDRAAGRTLQKR